MKTCDAQGRCNACHLTNLSYNEQLRLKERTCHRVLSKFCPIEPITESMPYRYRNKAQFVFRKRDGHTLVSGVYRSSTMTPAATDDCLLCSEQANEIIRVLRRLFTSFKVVPFDPYSGRGWLRSVTVREARATGQVMVVITGTDAVFPAKRTFTSALLKACPAITTVVLTVCADRRLGVGRTASVLYGDGTITDELMGRRFLLSPSSFYQINHDQCERLYRRAIDLGAIDNKVVLDAYCGVGTIGICCADRAKRVYAVEQNRSAVEDARRNAALNGIENITFTCADAKDYLRELAEQNVHIDVALIDPPRAGCAASFLKALAKTGCTRIVYISCNPETQARDLSLLTRLGYRARICSPFDMFPMTHHVETVVLMTRTDTGQS